MRSLYSQNDLPAVSSQNKRFDWSKLYTVFFAQKHNLVNLASANKNNYYHTIFFCIILITDDFHSSLKISTNVKCLQSHIITLFKNKPIRTKVIFIQVLMTQWIKQILQNKVSTSENPTTSAQWKRGHIVAATLCPSMFPGWQNVRQHCCVPRGHNKCFWSFSETFFVSRTQICVRNKCFARGKTGQHLGNMRALAMLPPQCVLVLYD